MRNGDAASALSELNLRVAGVDPRGTRGEPPVRRTWGLGARPSHLDPSHPTLILSVAKALGPFVRSTDRKADSDHANNERAELKKQKPGFYG